MSGSADNQSERPHYNIISNNQVQAIGDTGLILVNAFDNQIRQNTIQGCKADGILLATEGKEIGSYSDSNHLVGNSLNNCGKAPIHIADTNCRENILFGNLGAGNGEKIIDKVNNSITSTL